MLINTENFLHFMLNQKIKFRNGKISDLDNINTVIKDAIMTWDLPERVKRLSIGSYLYNSLDFEHINFIVAVDVDCNIIGVATWNDADNKDTPSACNAILLHGIYVSPHFHHKNIGTQLIEKINTVAMSGNYKGVLVKAQKDAIGFFISQGMKKLDVENPSRHYENRFWKDAITW